MTHQFLPVFATVLGNEPEGQVNEETREELVQLVKFLASKEPAVVAAYETLAKLV